VSRVESLSHKQHSDKDFVNAINLELNVVRSQVAKTDRDVAKIDRDGTTAFVEFHKRYCEEFKEKNNRNSNWQIAGIGGFFGLAATAANLLAEYFIKK
jgi:hypothetical protein